MDSAFSTAIPDSSLAAIGQLSENSRLGFARKNPALHRGIEWSKSTLALGLVEWSGKTASGPAVAANNNTHKTLTPQQQQCLNNAAQDHKTAIQRAHQDANHTWWVDIRNSVGGGAVGGCVVGAIGGEGIGCLPGGAIGALGGWLWGVPSGLWDASNQLDAATARAEEDYQTAQQRCMQ